jgi:hypothetical protein
VAVLSVGVVWQFAAGNPGAPGQSLFGPTKNTTQRVVQQYGVKKASAGAMPGRLYDFW